jgi:hypothetical protein
MEKEVVTGFELYSIALVAEDKQEDSMYIKAYPMEILPTHTGSLNTNPNTKSNTKDISGGNTSININKDVVLTAKWLPLNQSNRMTAPDVCKGETIFIYNINGTDRYFWNTAYVEPDLRKREKIIYFWSNKGSIEDGDDFMSKGYSLIIDTRNKVIQLHTADNDGEYTTYDLVIDTKEGSFTLVDGKGNKFNLDSKSDTFGFNAVKKVDIKLLKFAVSNGKDELMSLLAEWLQANIDEQHVGNLGIDTSLNSASVDKYKDLKARIEAFIG